ncbi:MAG: hypothetical protein HRF51_10565 [bacterium]|jgi:hypothetical protein
MSLKPIEIMGGESVYCINEGQLQKAYELAMSDSDSANRINAQLKTLEEKLTRNERAALSFLLIDRLLKTSQRTSE